MQYHITTIDLIQHGRAVYGGMWQGSLPPQSYGDELRVESVTPLP